jgi:transcriptional regulator with XRE-family HTH domain
MWCERYDMFSANLRAAVAVKGLTTRALEEQTKIPYRTIQSWLSPSDPRMPRADEAAKLARVLGTTVEALAFGEEVAAAPSYPYHDLIVMLNSLSPARLEDVKRLIAPWAHEVRQTSQLDQDLIADLKILPPERLDDLRRLISPWASSPRKRLAAEEDDESGNRFGEDRVKGVR